MPVYFIRTNYSKAEATRRCQTRCGARPMQKTGRSTAASIEEVAAGRHRRDRSRRSPATSASPKYGMQRPLYGARSSRRFAALCFTRRPLEADRPGTLGSP